MNILLVILLVLSTPLLSQEKKTIFLISTCRSLSTGFFRMMEARQDFECFHELTNAPYVAIHERDYYENYRDDCCHTFDEVTDTILNQAKSSNVFVKEVSFCCHGFLTKENPLLQSAHFAF